MVNQLTYIYYLHNGDNIPFYVGKTVRKDNSRLNAHKSSLQENTYLEIIDKMSIENENGNFAKPMLGAVASNIKDNKIMLLEEDLWCVHKYLDDLELPRVDKDSKEYSIVGRIKRLEERYLKQMSDLETMYLSGNCP
jgi:hypothetical protein